MNLETLLRLVWARRVLVLVLGVTTGFLVFVLGLFLVNYEAQASLVLRPLGLGPDMEGTQVSPVEQEAIRPRLGLVYSSRLALSSSHHKSFLTIISSRTIIEKVVHRLELDQVYKPSDGGWDGVVDALKQPLRFLYYGRLPAVEQSPVDFATARTSRQISAALEPNSSIVKITVRDRNAERSAAIGNALLDTLMEHSRESNRREAREAKEFIVQQIALIRADEVEQQAELDRFKAEYDIEFFRSFGEENARVSGRLATFKTQVEEAPFRRADLERTIAQTSEELAKYPEYSLLSSTAAANPSYTTLKAQLLQFAMQRDVALFDYPPTSPEIEALDRQIVLAEELLAAESERIASTEISQPDPTFQALLTAQLTAERELVAIPALTAQVRARIADDTRLMEGLKAATETAVDMEFRVSALRSQGERLEGELDHLRLLIARDVSEVEILDRSVVPRYPVIRGAPLSVFVVIGFVAGLVLGIGFVALTGQAVGRATRT